MLSKSNMFPLMDGALENTSVSVRKEIPLKKLIDKLNYINFQNGIIYVNFTHLRYNYVVRIPAYPQNCIGSSLNCVWYDPLENLHKLSKLKFDDFVFSDGVKTYQVEPEAVALNETGVCFVLPPMCTEITTTRPGVYWCSRIQIQLIQFGAIFPGKLIAFNPSFFYVQVTAVSPQTFSWMNPDNPVEIVLHRDNEVYYTGECRITSQLADPIDGKLVLTPMVQNIHRYSPKEFRSPRQALVPTPTVVFRHPFTHKRIDLKVDSLSGSGFSVLESPHRSVLLPGMIIPQVSLNFAGGVSLSCRAQVIHRRNPESSDNKNMVRCGLAILDMDIQQHMKLLGILQQARNERTYICNEVNMDDLWHFFFETGFIYPHKYEFIRANKDQIKDTYEKLYTQSPSIARHFIYQDKNQILGHMAMLRFYQETWLIHHYAANRSVSSRAGVVVLDQIGRFVNDSHNIYSIHMKFLMCYFRPENRFPQHVFGGAAKAIGNPQGCSVDDFLYFHRSRTTSSALDLPRTWKIKETQGKDLEELFAFYEYHSSGLVLDALDLLPGSSEQTCLHQEYARLGYKRKRYLFSLFEQDDLKAIFMINVSDVGLNLSDLTNCMKIFVLDPDGLTPEFLKSAIRYLSGFCEQEIFPVLLFPVLYAGDNPDFQEKIYTLWVLNMQFTDAYFRHIKQIFGSVHR
jgi:hypothetical protein